MKIDLKNFEPLGTVTRDGINYLIVIEKDLDPRRRGEIEVAVLNNSLKVRGKVFVAEEEYVKTALDQI